MTYGIYKSARDASWRCLIHCKVSSLPVNPVSVATAYGIRCIKADKKLLDGASGRIIRSGDAVAILCDATAPKERQAFTILHELGHYLLGHLDGASTEDCEAAADRFAADVLMPACVLWKLDVHSESDIIALCGVSRTAAGLRAKRLKTLYARGRFLTSPLERQVCEQFQDFISQHR